MTKFVVLDGSALMYRAVLSSGPKLYSPKGELTKGPYVFVRTLFKLCRELTPSHLVMALDSPKETLFRRKLFPEYKTNRKSKIGSEVGFGQQIQRCLSIAKALGVPLVRKEGFEADDLIATLSSRFEVPCTIVSMDKDLHQLVSDRVEILDPFKDDFVRAQQVKDRWSVSPEQVVEVQILVGDRGDNVPGVDGIGIKGAQKLILEYGTADAVKRARLNLKHTVSKALEEADLDLLRKLLTLRKDVPLDMEFVQFKFEGLKVEMEAKRIFKDLGFQRWAS